MYIRTTTPVARGVVFVIVAAVAWGTGGVVAAVLYRDTGLGPVATSFWRTAIGVLLLAVWSVSRGRAAAPTPTRRPWVTLVTGVGLAVYQTAYYAAVVRSGVGFATVLTLGSAPVLIAMAARFVIGERLGVTGAVALAVAPLGLLLVVGGTTGPGTLSGALLSLLSAAGYAAVTVLNRSYGGDPARTTLLGFAVATACLTLPAVAEGLWPTRGSTVEAAVLLAYLGVFSSALAYSLYFASLATVRATTVSILTLSEPVTAAALAVLLLAERLTPTMVAGTAVLLGVVVLLARSEASPST